MLSVAVVALAIQIATPNSEINSAPVIAVLTQPADAFAGPGRQYLVASYVKWIESAGARVVPLFYNATDAELAVAFNSVSGLVLAGGHCEFHKTQYGNNTVKLLEMAANSDSKFPVWGTCQGFQQLNQYGSGGMEPSILHRTDSEDLLLPLIMGPAAAGSRMLAGAPAIVLEALENDPITVNLHHYSVLANESKLHPRMATTFTPLATNKDRNGVEFVSMMEGITLPFYGTQFHPEKNAYEWDQGWCNGTIPGVNAARSSGAIAAMQYFSDFFVSEARKCTHRWDGGNENLKLIYHYAPVYTATVSPEEWELCYIF